MLNQSSSKDNTIEFVKMIENNLPAIQASWMKNPKVHSILKKYNMSDDLFKSHFTPKIFNCCNNSLLGNGGEEKIPIVYVLMVFFHERVKYTEFAQLFNALRQEYIRTLFKYVEFQNLFDNINNVFDENLSKIFHEITLHNNSIHDHTNHKSSKKLYSEIEITKASQNEETDFNINQDMLDDLEEYEGILIDALEHNDILTEEVLVKIALVFKQYGKLLSDDTTFMKLSDSFFELVYTIENCDFSNLETTSLDMIQEYISILSDELNKWRLGLEKGLIIEDNKSLVSNLQFLENMLTHEPEAQGEEENFEWF